MPNEFDYMSELRAGIRAQLSEKAFLKIDRGDHLFITNAPIFTETLPALPNFIAETERKMLYLTPSEVVLADFEDRFGIPASDFSASMLRYRGKGVTPAALMLFTRGLKLTEAGAYSDVIAYDRAVRQHSAAAMRIGDTRGIYACALLADLLVQQYCEVDKNEA